MLRGVEEALPDVVHREVVDLGALDDRVVEGVGVGRGGRLGFWVLLLGGAVGHHWPAEKVAMRDTPDEVAMRDTPDLEAMRDTPDLEAMSDTPESEAMRDTPDDLACRGFWLEIGEAGGLVGGAVLLTRWLRHIVAAPARKETTRA